MWAIFAAPRILGFDLGRTGLTGRRDRSDRSRQPVGPVELGFNRFWAPHHLNHSLSLSPNNSLILTTPVLSSSLPSSASLQAPNPPIHPFHLISSPRKDQIGVVGHSLHDFLPGVVGIQVLVHKGAHSRYIHLCRPISFPMGF